MPRTSRDTPMAEPPDIPVRWAYLGAASAAVLQFAPSFAHFASEYLGSASRDMDRMVHHFVGFAVDTVRSGAIPQWNPFIFCGTPFLPGTGAALWDPLNLPLLVALPQPLSLNLAYVMHAVLLAVTTVLLVRSRGGSAGGALLAGVLAAGSSAVAPRIFAGHFTLFCTVAWIPLVFWAQEQVFRHGFARAWLLAVASALLFLGGHAQIAYYAGLLLAVSAVVKAGLEGRRGFAGRLCRLAAVHATAAVWALAIAAIEALPLFDVVRGSARRTLHDPGWLAFFAMPPESLLSLLAPDVLGRGDAYLGRWFWWETCWTVGIVGLGLAIVAGVRRLAPGHRDPLPYVAVVAALLGLLGSLPGSPAIGGAIPGWSLFRGHAKTGVFVVVLLAVLAGHGLDLARAESARSRRAILAGFGVLVLACIVAAAGASRDRLLEYVTAPSLAAQRPAPIAAPAIAAARGSDHARASLLTAAAFAAAACALVAAQGRLGPRSGVLALTALAAVDLGRFAVPAEAVRFRPEPRLPAAAAAFLHSHASAARVEIAGSGLGNAGISSGIAGVGGADVSVPRPIHTFLATYFGDPPGWPVLDATLDHDDPLLDAANLVYFAFEGGARPRDATLLPVATLDGIDIRRRPTALPRAWIVGAARWVPDDEDAIRAALRGMDFHREVLLAGDGRPEAPASAPATAVQVRHIGTRRVQMRAPCDGWLVLAETYSPRWRATVDGHRARVFRANGAFRAVRVSAGDDVVYEYRNPTLSAGIVLTVLGLLAAAWAGARPRSNRGRVPLPTPGTP